jgi:parallel beta-helix repeat protein
MSVTLPRCVIVTLLLVLFFRSSLPARAAPASFSTFVVTNATDDICILACPVCDGSFACSLRQAIGKSEESASGTYNNIRFSAGVDWSANENEIVIYAPLPLIQKEGTWIDGRTPAGALVYPRINAFYADGDYVLSVYASAVRLSNLSIYNADPNYGEILIRQTTPDHHGGVQPAGVQIAYNWLGMPRDSSSCSTARYGGTGIRVDAGWGTAAAGGGTAYIYGNVIGCHGAGAGIYLVHDLESTSIVSPSRYVYVGQASNGAAAGNWIGVSPTGSALANYWGVSICEAYSETLTSNVIAHNFDGVSMICGGGVGVFYGGAYNYIGLAGLGNYIYANGRDGIYLRGGLYQNSVQGNTIGLDAAGFARPNGRHGITLEYGASDTLIGGFSKALEGNLISGNSSDGIHIEGPNVARTVIEGNRIGTSPAGNAARGNGGHGIAIAGGAQDTAIGGALAGLGNIIAGNGADGIHVSGAVTDSLTVSLNLIGTSANGQAAVGNLLTGIEFDGVAGARVSGNTISGNGLAGVWIRNSSYVTLTTNMVGLNSAGTAALPNLSDGVQLTDGSQYNLIGGPASADRNVISGNTFSGVALSGLTTNYNRIASNFIGLNAGGNAALPNGYAGIALSLADLNSIGSGSSGNQYISGNSREGIWVSRTYYTDIDSTNYIGVAFNGTTPMGNGLQGVLLVGDVQNSTVTPAVVAYNGEAGVALVGLATSNRVYPQAVYGNGGLPIDLGNDGPTLNDPGDADSGPNTLLNYPEVNAVSGSILSGTACADCMIIVFRAVGNPAAPRGGYSNYLGDTTADGVGHWNVAIPGGLTAADVTLMTCDDTVCAHGSNTSELRPRPQSFLPLIRR